MNKEITIELCESCYYKYDCPNNTDNPDTCWYHKPFLETRKGDVNDSKK
jgi:hypothetical protein